MRQKPKFKQTEIGMIPEEWEVINLRENCESIQYGYTATASEFPVGPKFLRGTDIRNKIIDWSSVPYCRISDDDLKKYRLLKGDIVITRMGTPGDSAYFDKEFPVVFASYLIRIKVNQKLYPKFIYYYLQSERYRNFIRGIVSTSATPGVNAQHLTNIDLPLPPLPEQRAIAKVLSDLDAKIELNQQMNKTLEAIGQAIFKHWFIDFEFPNEEGKPYKSSGGEMVYNEELGKEIPKGWSVVNINEAVTFIKGVEPGYKNYSQEKKSENYLPFFRVQDIIEYGNVPKTFVDRNLLQGKTFNNNDILISLDGTIGRVFIGGQGGYSSGIRKVVAKEKFISKSLIFFFLKSAEFQDSLELFSGGETTIKHAGGAIKNIKFVFKKETCERFAEKINSIFEKILSNISEVQTLSSLRDSLLPKLMSGKIRVPVEARI